MPASQPFDEHTRSQGRSMFRWRYALLGRLALAVGLLVVALEPGRLGPDTDLFLLAIACSVVPWHLLLLWLAFTDRPSPWYLAYVDATIVAASAMHLRPDLWPLAAVAAPVIVAVEAGQHGSSRAHLATVFSIGAFGASGWLNEADHLPATLLGIAAGCLAASQIVGHLTNERVREMRTQSDLLAELSASVWVGASRGARFERGRIREVLGYTRREWEEIDGLPALIHPDDRAVFQNPVQLDEVGQSMSREFRMRHADGQWVWLRDTITRIEPGHGNEGLRGICVDITGERQAGDALARFSQVLDEFDTPVHILEFGPDLHSLSIVGANAAARPLDLQDPELIAACRRGRDTGEKIISLEQGYEIWPLDDLHLAVVLAGPPPDAPVGRPQPDPLTDLAGRAALRATLERHLTIDPEARLALLVMDLDQFKEVNDTLGHAQGDQLLRLVAERVAEVAAPGDLVCRLGGDEFALLLVHEGPERAQLVAADLETAIAHPIVLDGVHIQAGVSIGAALSPLHGAEPDLLLQRADVAMYQAKSSGETYRLYDPHDDRFTMRRLTLLGELPRALRENELIVHYQPKIDLRTSSVIGVEALVRWQHPEHGMVPPDEFIELAEVSGLVRELTRQVIEESLAQLNEWDGQGIHLTVAVNLSVRNFGDPDLAVWIERSLMRYGISASRLMLEITESEVMDDVVLALGVLEQLSALGVKASIDDFGTGYSSLSYLRQLPIDEIKIDRSFVGTMAINPNDTVIVRSIIELGHNLDLDVVAEGVEDEWTLDSLRSLGCDEAQGYYFSRPVPAEEITNYVLDFRRSLSAPR